MADYRASLEGCMIGCAVGDSIALPYEGMKPSRISKMLRLPLQHHFLFGKGMVSDDTDHTIFVAQCLALSPADPDRFAKLLAWRLRFWLLCLPAGIGMATLKSILKLWLGFSPSHSGIYSAGNGAAMRSAIIGVVHHEDKALRRDFVKAATLLTHTDPKALHGAQAIADLAARMTRNHSKPILEELEQLLTQAGEGNEWQEIVQITMQTCRSGNLKDAVTPAGLKRGVSGYIYHTLPVAVAAWYLHFDHFRAMTEAIVQLGGDTDTVAAIAGSLAGISLTRGGIPDTWVVNIIDTPHSVDYLSKLAQEMSADKITPEYARFSWWLFPRGILFTLTVLTHGFRRCLPPY